MLYHAHQRTGWVVYHEGKEVAHFHGGAVLDSEELVDGRWLRALRSGRVWVVDMGFGGWRSGVVPAPASWVLKEVRVFPEVYQVQGQIEVFEYDCQATNPPP
jgi:hypothetical protein